MSVERDVSRERVARRRQHSSSDSGRLSVPMWDSSDPDRAPPPLPLNPANPNLSPTRAGTSAHVAAAAQALAERARENAGPSPYTINAMHDRSPDRSPTRNPQHRRLQSLQTGSLSTLKSSLENNRQTDWDSSRPGTPLSMRESFSSSPSPSRCDTPTPGQSSKDPLKDTPALRPSTRPPLRSILSENTPPSATMLAIQNMPYRDSEVPPFSSVTNAAPLANITNAAVRTPQNLDGIFSQMQNLTSIATTLQKEMAALSRRSKDNATDLISLKEATSTRDEDIRKSLRELVGSVRASEVGLLGPPPRIEMSRPASAFGASNHYLDNKPYNSPPFLKSFSLPKLTTQSNVDSHPEHDRAPGPSPYSVEGAASVAMLEKIVREMATKEGQERLLSTLPEILEKATKESTISARKVEELAQLIRAKSTTQALVRQNHRIGPASDAPPRLDLDFGSPGGVVIVNPVGAREVSMKTPQREKVVSEELLRLLQKIKDSVSQSGGLTGEVKSLVRELRGEVLGMGRELGRKLEDIELPQMVPNAKEDEASKEELCRVVREGLADLKEQMDQVIQTRRRQSSSSAVSRLAVDSSEIYAVVKQALAEHGLDQSKSIQEQGSRVDHEAILAAVREAYESYKPEIELQQFGLERDEILQCLKEGLEDYQSSKASHDTSGISRDDVMDAVQEAMQHFTPPAPISESSEIKEEIMMTIRECLEQVNNQRPTDADRKIGDFTREDILDAVREGVGGFQHENAKEVEINREDLFQAIKAGLDSNQASFSGDGSEVLNSLQDIVEGMRVEIKQQSTTSAKDTEQILDAMRDGLEALRAELESYMDRAQNVTGKEEIVDTLRDGLESLRNSMQSYVAGSSRELSSEGTSAMMDYIKAEFGRLHEGLAAQTISDAVGMRSKEEILAVLSVGFTDLKSNIGARGTSEPTEDTLDAIRAEFEQFREAVLSGSAAHKNEVLDAIQESLGGIQANIVVARGPEAEANNSVIETMKAEFEALRATLAAPVLQYANAGDKDEILRNLKQSLDDIRDQIAADQSEAAQESLGLIREELETFRDGLGASLIPQAPAGGNIELLEAIRDGLDGLRSFANRNEADSENGEALDSVRDELEQLRQSLASTLVHGGRRADTDEILDAVRLGLDELRSQIEQKLGLSEQMAPAAGEVLDALNDRLADLRIDIAKMAEKPVDMDMTVSYDILDTLKDGLSAVRADIERLRTESNSMKNGEVVLADPSNSQAARGLAEDSPAGNARKNDLEKLEVMLAHLQIKVEAMDQNIQSGAPLASAFAQGPPGDEALIGVESTLRDLQAAVATLATREHEMGASSATKEDTDAIETLLQNTKAKIDDHVLPALDSAVTKDHLDTVEAIVRLTSESVDGLAARLESDFSTKDDVAAIGVLLQEATASLNDIKDQVVDPDGDRIASREGLDTIGAICNEIKNTMDSLPTSDATPSKAEIEHITALLEDLQKEHAKVERRYENDVAVTAKAFDDRKHEAKSILDQISDLKIFVEESRDELKSRMKRGNQDVRALDEILQSVEDKIDNAPNAISDVQEVMKVIIQEFERARSSLGDLKSNHESSSTAFLGKQDEVRATIVLELANKVDERFKELMARYEEQQVAAEHTAQEVEQATRAVADRAAQQEELLSASRAMAEDLKITIDTLGASVTSISPALTEATEKMSDDAKTVFNKVDELYARLDENHMDAKSNHQLTRDDVNKTLVALAGIHQEITGFQPTFMESLSNILAITAEHFEHSKRNAQRSSEDFGNKIDEIKSTVAALPMPRLEAPPPVTPVTEKYDDAKVHHKLDELLSHAFASKKTLPGLDKIDEIHQQVMSTATEVSAFVAFQNKMATAVHDNKEEEVRQAALDLNKYVNEREELEVKVVNLREAKQSLAADIESLMAEQDELTSQKMRLTAEVSSLQTALGIRREELQTMDARADALERRIIDGVLDHSRALLLAKKPKGPPNMNLRRVVSNASHATASTTTPSNIAIAGIGMAVRARPAVRGNGATSSSKDRRILSLGQITNNVPNGGKGGLALPRNAANGLTNLKRGQSMKTQIRKSTWAGQDSVRDVDKENDAMVGDSDLDGESETDGRSRGTMTSMTDRSGSYNGNGALRSERITSYGTGPSEYSYGTGSYLTGTETDRRTSYGSTIRSMVGGGPSIEDSIEGSDESSEDSEWGKPGEEQRIADEIAEQTAHEVQLQQQHSRKSLVLRPPDDYDSGLGSDLPTAALSATVAGSDYFPAIKEEAREW